MEANYDNEVKLSLLDINIFWYWYVYMKP